MSTTQAFRNALHIPYPDPAAGNVVSVTAPGGSLYPTAWVSASGLPEAPNDGQLYARRNLGWTTFSVTADWNTMVNKPATFPPTLPILESNVVNLVADLAAKADASALAAKADLANPVFTGNPTAPTATTGDNDTSIATTAFVQTALGAIDCGTF